MITYSIIIVNYKTGRLVCDCLQTIFDQDPSNNFEVIIVDNDSRDDSESIIRGNYPQVKWIQMGYNSGFARGNNAGMKAATGDVFLLLNSDTLNQNNAIQTCYERFCSSSHIACGIQLLNLDGSPQISGNYFMKGGLNHLMSLPYTGRLLRAIGMGLKVHKTNVAKAEGEVVVDWINGAFLMVRKNAVQAAGMLDEDFFLYSEEIEWCSRLRKTGTMCIYGDLHVIHLMGATTTAAFGSTDKGYSNLADRKGLQLILSGMVRIRKQFGVGWFLFHLLAYFLTIPIYGIITLMRTILFQRGVGSEWKSWAGFSGNTFKVMKRMFLIISNKPHFYKVL